MSRLSIWEALGDLPETYVADALPPSWTRRGASTSHREKRSRLAEFFLDNGWVAAVLSGVVTLGLIIAIVLAGRGESDTPVGTEPVGSNRETLSESGSESGPETVPETEAGVQPGLDSTTPYDHPLDSKTYVSITADGVTTDLNRGYIYEAFMSLSDDDHSDAPDGVWSFAFPPIDGYYLYHLSADPSLITIRVSSPEALSWKASDWRAETVFFGLDATYDEHFKEIDTPKNQLPDGVYYLVFKAKLEGATHNIGDSLYDTRMGGYYAHYHIPCRVIIGDAAYTPPAVPPTPPEDDGIQREFKSSCFSSNGDGTCSFSFMGYQHKKILQIPAQSPDGDRVTSIKACNPQLLGSTVILPDSVSVIERRAFRRSYGLEAVILGGGVREIGEEAFHECVGLRTITFSDGIERIGASAFSQCHRLAAVHLPNSVTALGNSAFYGCFSLSEITLSERLTSIEHDTFNSCSKLGAVTIPTGVRSIEMEAFYNCVSLARLTLSPGIERIGERAFMRCLSLDEVRLPATVTAVEKEAFTYCDKLRTVTLAEGLLTLGDHAFAWCPLLSDVKLPASVTSLGRDVFLDSGSNVESD